MNKNGPIIVIEDDADDRYLFDIIFKELSYQNEPLFFSNGIAAFDYLVETETLPFLIFSDVNMPEMDGFELRDKLQNHHKMDIRCIPYIFFSTSGYTNTEVKAYTLAVQGFFIKPSNYEELVHTIKAIVEYWQLCNSPINIFKDLKN